ncbi:MAG: hypothetical protein U0Q15_01385 [Kineosporiaceae bacterium]
MSGLQGADVAALEDLGRRMGGSAQALRGIQAALRAGLSTAPWVGPGADRFRADFDGAHTRALLGAASLLEDAGRTLAVEAAEQGAASDAGTGASGAASAGGAPGSSGAPGGAAPDGPVGEGGALGFLAKLKLLKEAFKKAKKGVMMPYRYASWLKDAFKDGVDPAVIEKKWKDFLGINEKIDGWKLKAMKAANLSEDSIAAIGKYKAVLGKVALPLTVVSGLHDLFTGGDDEGWHGVATRVAGGVGAVGAGVLTASVVFGAAVPPVGLAIAGAAVTAYAVYSVGNLIYEHREAIGHALSTGWDAVSGGAQAVADHVAEKVADVKQAAGKVVDTLTHPLRLIPHLSVF